MSMRGSSCDDISFSRSTLFWRSCRPADAAADVATACFRVSATFISLNVFHWPQLGHLPIHLAYSCPQFSQTYITFSFAII
jgi:hypothetical protein